ncbi:MAG: bifunctional glutamate N-acetyltransferase/amino-acid acetyltransferase ArgJ [bacterium]
MTYKTNKTYIKIIKNGGITSPCGFLANGIHCGIKHDGKKDLCLIFSETAATAAGVFTKNKVKAAPVTISREQLKNNRISAIVINSGNANACTGKKGLDDAWQMVNITAGVLEIESKEVLVASTGRIGAGLPIEKIKHGIIELKDKLSKSGGHNSALAIMTTDLYPKEIALEFVIDKKRVRLGGMCKGAGMIHPDMATMLCFLTCDINIEKKLLQHILEEAVNDSFNLITVDGDRSTNDTVVITANGMAGNRNIKEGSSDYNIFKNAVSFVCRFLAKEIVKNGEGATKLINIKVNGAKSENEAKKAAFAIANSSLVKTSIFGEDPNWGRIMSAVGSSGINVTEEKIDIFYGKNKITANGQGIEKAYSLVKKYLSNREIELTINLKQGKAHVSVLTCDLTPEYVKINAEKS